MAELVKRDMISIYDKNSVIRQCEIYSSILKEELNKGYVDPKLWASKLGVDYHNDSDFSGDFVFDINNPDMWSNIDKCIAIHSNLKKLQIVFEMKNNKSVAIRLLDIKGYWHHILLRRLIQLEEEGCSSQYFGRENNECE